MLNHSPPNCPGLLGETPGRLSLRVCTSPYEGRVIHLRAAKCSIGSAPNCTLRLRADLIDPCHVVVYRSAHGTFAQRWSRNTALNGQAFDIEPLRAGDRLSVGAVEFEVITASADEACDRDELDRDVASQIGALRSELVQCQSQLHTANARRDELEQFVELGRAVDERRNEQFQSLETDNRRLESCLAKLRAEVGNSEDLTDQTIRLLRAERDHLARRLRESTPPAAGDSAKRLSPRDAGVKPNGDAVESYMDHLMKRMGGDVEITLAADAVESRQVPHPDGAPADNQEAQPVSPPMEPITVAPENAMDVGAMRALANVTAQHALDTSDWRRARLVARLELIASIIVFVPAAVLALLSLSATTAAWTWLGMTAALAGFAAGAFWVARATKRFSSPKP